MERQRPKESLVESETGMEVRDKEGSRQREQDTETQRKGELGSTEEGSFQAQQEGPSPTGHGVGSLTPTHLLLLPGLLDPRLQASFLVP